MAGRRFKRGPVPREGDRFPNGRLKPVGPNARVVEQRRALLGAEPDAKVDLSKAENPLDLALARGWLSEARHRTARSYCSLVNNVLNDLPSMKSGSNITDNLRAAVEWTDEGSSTARSGINLPADLELANIQRRYEEGQVSSAEYTRAEKAHRRARINWSSVPSREMAKIWDAMTELRGVVHNPPGDKPTAGELKNAQKLRLIQEHMSHEERRILFEVCVLEQWPAWVTLRVWMRPVPFDQERRRILLESALDKVLDAVSPRAAQQTEEAPAQRKRVAKREYAVRYIDENGQPIAKPFEVVIRSRG